MTDGPSPETTRTPYEAASAEFFGLFGSSDLTQGRIQDRVAGILQLAMPAGTADLADYRQKLITNWTERGTRGVEVEEGAVMERQKRPEDIEAERQRKIALLCDISGFLVGSEYSVLSETQKRNIIARSLIQMTHLELPTKKARDRLGNAIAPYIAAAVERAGVSDYPDVYVDMGRAALSLMDTNDLGGVRSRNRLSRALKHPDRHVGSPLGRLGDVLRKVI